MAIARTSLIGATFSGAVFSYTTASFTPPANSLLVVTAFLFSTTGGNITVGSTPSGGSLTYTRQGPVLNPDNGGFAPGAYSTHETWTAPVGGSPSSMTVTIANAASFDSMDIHIVAYTGYDVASPIGATGNFTNVYNTTGINAAPTLTLSATPASSSYIFASVTAGANNAAGPVTQGSGWTEIYDWVSANTAGLGFQSQEITGSTSTTVGWADIDTNDLSGGMWGCSGFAIEIKAAATSVAITVPQGNLSLSPTPSSRLNTTGRVPIYLYPP